MEPKMNGTYTAANQHFKFVIHSARSDKGVIDATYKTSDSPEEGFEVKCTGGYAWVGRETNPFPIRFDVTNRPADRSYCIFDSWTGIRQTDGNLLMDGTRSYVSTGGKEQVTSLGKQTFSHVP